MDMNDVVGSAVYLAWLDNPQMLLTALVSPLILLAITIAWAMWGDAGALQLDEEDED